MNKSFICFSILCLSAVTAIAEPSTNQKLNIEHVTVFLSGAELRSTARVTLLKGENEIRFSNVAGNVNDQSISVSATNGAVVESVTFQNNFLATDNMSPKSKALNDSIELLQRSAQRITNKMTQYAEQILVLQANRKVGGDNTGLSATELQKTLDLVGNKMENYLNARDNQADTLRKVNEHVARLQNQLDEEQKLQYQPGGQITVKFFAKEAGITNIGITYVVGNSGWEPVYDVWAEDAHGPMKLYYKASVYQNTGVKWDNVHLTLSTGNPDEGMQAPELSPWYLAFYIPQSKNLTYSWSKAKKEQPMADTMEIEDPVTGAATKRFSNPYIIDGVQVQGTSTIDEHVAVNNAGVNTSFDIDLPYGIPTDGQKHVVAVKKYDITPTYSYIARPKLDNDAFLTAHVTNWQELNLLPGKTNIFYEGTYVGQGEIDPKNVRDTLDISLGRDKKIVVKRERDVQRRTVRTIGTNVRETFGYNITVRNTRKEPINITIEDQQPVSNDKDIAIEDVETSKADFTESTGLMKWDCTIAPNETRKIPFGYTIKYPKGKVVADLN